VTEPKVESPVVTAAPGEILWRCDDEVIRALDSRRSYRDALIAWFDLHGLDAWHVRAAAVAADAADANGNVRVEAIASRVEGGAVKVEHVVVPLLRDPPAPMTGWTQT
jgi:hypothetical protein